MKKLRNYYFRTLAALLVVTCAFVGIHMYNNLTLHTTQQDDMWGDNVDIARVNMKQKPIMSAIGDNLLTLAYTEEGQIIYNMSSSKGEFIEQGIGNLESFNKNKVDDIYLIENKLFYTNGDKLYFSEFIEGSGFNSETTLLSGVKGFNAYLDEGNFTVSAYNDEEISIYSFKNNSLELIQSSENKYNIIDIMTVSVSEQDYLFIINEVEKYNYSLIAHKIEGNNLVYIKDVDNIIFSTRDYIRDIYIESYNDKLVLVYTVSTYVDGIRTVSAKVSLFDGTTFDKVSENAIGEQLMGAFVDMDDKIHVISSDDKIYFIGSALNINNKYASGGDIFVSEIDSDGALINVTFISSTEGYSKMPYSISANNDFYVTWLDLGAQEHKLMMTSTNDEFKAFNEDYTSEDYKEAFIKAATSPFYGLAFSFIKAFQVFLIMSVLFFIGMFIMKKLSIENELIKFGVYIAIYIILNVILFQGSYYSGEVYYLMPDMLKFNIAQYIMPLFINVISGLVLFAYHKDKKVWNYFSYLIIYMSVDIYLGTLMYVPFSMVNILAM